MTQSDWNDVDAARAVDSADLINAKSVVRSFNMAVDSADVSDLASEISARTTKDYEWRGSRPFYELHGVEEVVDTFWTPLRESFAPVQRRADVFFAGANVVDDGASIWTCEMGHFLGLFDRPWLDIPPTGRMVFVRYVEFHRVEGGRIAETAMFIDLLSVMRQAGQYPLPPQTGAAILVPGPLTNDGILLEGCEADESAATLALVHEMGRDLNNANAIAEATGDNRVPAEQLRRTWHEDMIWYGPDGIGASYTIERYQQQHQYPFRFNLSGKTFNGHVARFAEGNYACFFGWPNLTNTPDGGFLGLPASNPAGMRVVDVYRRDGDKLAENWVVIDLPHWLSMQGLDVLERMRQLNGEKF